MKSFLFLFLTGLSEAAIRFGCSTVSIQRLDPLVEPGKIPSAHVHQIVGGNAFNATMTGDIGEQGSCTTCAYTEDFSNYWTAVMFYKAKNGTYKRVPQVANGGPEGLLTQNGGITVYYLYGASKSRTAFKKGFRMLAGDAANTNPAKVAPANLCHRCWTNPVIDNSIANFVGGSPCADPKDTVEIPTSPDCKYIRQTVIFPSCWDGKNLDSPDHKSHVAYIRGADKVLRGGTCPPEFPVQVSQIMLEIMWDLRQFTERSADSFVYSMNNGYVSFSVVRALLTN